MSKKHIEDFVALLSKRDNTTPKEIEKQVLEIFGVVVNLEVLQERKVAKELTENDIKEGKVGIPMFKDGESVDMTAWSDEHIFKK